MDLMSRRRILLAQAAQESAVLATATGNPIKFETDLTRPLKSLAVPFNNLSGCSIFSTGKNLFDGEWEFGTWNTNTGNKGNSSSDLRCKNLIAAPSGVINFSRTDTSVSFYALFIAYKKDKSYSRYLGARSNNASITLAADEGYFTFFLYARTTPLENAMFELTTQSNPTYEPYHGQTIPISWQSEAGTIVNGTVTLNDDGSADVVNSDTGNNYHLANVGNLTTFLGTNTIWTDTNGTNTAEYWKKS